MLALMEKIIFLKQVPLFQNISPEELVPVARIAAEKATDAGETIFEEGTPETGLHIILKGNVEISRANPGQKNLVVAVLGPSECFGEMSLFDDLPHSATAKAQDRLEYLIIKKSAFLELIYNEPAVIVGIIKIFCRRLRAVNTRH